MSFRYSTMLRDEARQRLLDGVRVEDLAVEL
jgi:hypothetical protein